jgi:hypothetical protein
MAGESSSSNVAVVAIVILVMAALGFGYYYMQGNRGVDTSNATVPAKVEVNTQVPAASEKPSTKS